MTEPTSPGARVTMTRRADLVIGYTRADRLGADYVPMMDGYRPGAAQDTVTVRVPARGLSGSQLADLAFVATNAPPEVIEGNEGATEILDALIAAAFPWRAVSVGDTVTVDGTMYACQRIGWTQVDA